MIVTGRLVPHFTLKEMQSNDGAGMELTPEAVRHAQMLEEFRVFYGRTISPTSWFRSPYWNNLIGGVEDSKHLYGIATDILYPSDYWQMSEERKQVFVHNVIDKWHEICTKHGTGGRLYWYDWGMHMDSRIGDFKSGYLGG